jgi:hypothetical protein
MNKENLSSKAQISTINERLLQLDRASLLAKKIAYPGKDEIADIFYYIPSTPIPKDKLQNASDDELLNYYNDIGEIRKSFIQQMRYKTLPYISTLRKDSIAEKRELQDALHDSADGLNPYPAPESVTKDKTKTRLIYEILFEDYPSKKGLSVKEITERMNERLPERYKVNESVTKSRLHYLFNKLKDLKLYIEDISHTELENKRKREKNYRLSLLIANENINMNNDE